MADLLYAAVIEKFTGEQFDEDFDFDGIIPEGTTVTTATVTVAKVDGTDATSTVFKDKTVSGSVVTVTLYTGTSETGYVVKVVVAASDTSPANQTKLLNVTEPGAYR